MKVTYLVEIGYYAFRFDDPSSAAAFFQIAINRAVDPKYVGWIGMRAEIEEPDSLEEVAENDNM